MPNHGTSRQRTAAPLRAFPPGEWRSLVRLPGQVAVAATSVRTERPAPSTKLARTGAVRDGSPRVPATRSAYAGRDGVAEALAGLEAIAAGRGSVSALVRDIVSAIYLEDGGYQPTDDVLGACGRAGAVLAARAPREDADAYLHWIEAIATRVCHAGKCDGVFDTGGPALTRAQWRFLADLRAAFTR